MSVISAANQKQEFGVEVKAGELPQSKWLWLSTHDSGKLPPHYTFRAANLSTDTSQALSCVLSLQKEASRLLGRPEVPSSCKWWFPCWAAALNWEKRRWQGGSGHITFKLAFSSCSSLTLMAAWLFCRSNFKFRCSTSSFLLTKSSLIFSNCSFKSKTFQWNKWR